jgi:hypothetical protein
MSEPTNPTAIESTSLQSESKAKPGAQPAQGLPTNATEAPEANASNKLGSQLAASKRLARKAAQQSALLRQQEAAAREVISKAEEFEKLPDDELIRRIATKRGVEPHVVIRDAIAKLTDTQLPQVKIDEKTDPNIKALYERLEAESKERLAETKRREELERKLAERDEQAKLEAAEKAQAETVSTVNKECDASSKAAWETETDLAILFDDEQELSKAVFAKVGKAVLDYQAQYKQSPSNKEVLEAIKDAPSILLAEARKSPRFQRIAELRTQAEDAKPKPRGALLKGPKVETDTGGAKKEPVKLVTKISDRERMANATKSIPDDARFFGFPNSR